MNKETIRKELVVSMKAKDTVRTGVLRNILTAFTNELVARGGRADDEIQPDDAEKVILRLAKQRKDSIEQFKKGGREDLVEKEEAELEVLEEYLPEQMNEEDIRKVVEAKKEALGIDDASKKGMLMGAVMKELGSKADGNVVKKIVEGLF